MAKRKASLRKKSLFTVEEWIALYDVRARANYAVEFLTAASEHTAPIPNSEWYPLPAGIEPRDIEDSVLQNTWNRYEEEGQARVQERAKGISSNIKRFWAKGTKIPTAVRSLDQLRECPNPDFRIDLLSPELYSGEIHDGNNIPYSVSALPGLAYLYIANILSGHYNRVNPKSSQINPKGRAFICPTGMLGRDALEKKIWGVFAEGNRDNVELRQHYANVLELLGRPKRLPLNHTVPSAVVFLDRLAGWMHDEVLSEGDYAHGWRTMSKVVEAFMDFSFGIKAQPRHNQRKKYLEVTQFAVPGFKTAKRSRRFAEFFRKAWRIINDDVPIEIDETRNIGGAFYTRLYAGNEYLRAP